MKQDKRTIVIVGAGPAGLTAAYKLVAREGHEVIVLEADPQYVGGISKTVEYKGYRFDIGGHRFFSKSAEVENFWSEILGDELLNRPRKSRIYYRGKFFSYPLKPVEALLKLGIFESTRCVLSYFKAKALPKKNPTNFEDWVSNNFGKRLFQIFFKTYTEKVWGMNTKEISADWAAQRIKGLSLMSALTAALKPQPKKKGEVIKTLIDSFRYPRLGPGMMWERCAEKFIERGGRLYMGTHLSGLHREVDGRWKVKHAGAHQGEIVADELILSSALGHLGDFLENPKVPELKQACSKLKYRDFVTVALMSKGEPDFDDNWIYIHDPGVLVGRVQNFKSWSPEMVPQPGVACFGLEYFCHENDGIWNMKDEELIALGKKELAKLGLVTEDAIFDGCVVRQKKAYPVYDHEYREVVGEIRDLIESNLSGLHVVGRNGMHKYNNADHSMMTAMLAVENIVAGKQVYNLWAVNEDAEYHESGEAGESASTSGSHSGSTSGLRAVPQKVRHGGEQKIELEPVRT